MKRESGEAEKRRSGEAEWIMGTHKDLHIDEHQIFEAIEVLRRKLLNFLKQRKNRRQEEFEAAKRFKNGSGNASTR